MPRLVHARTRYFPDTLMLRPASAQPLTARLTRAHSCSSRPTRRRTRARPRAGPIPYNTLENTTTKYRKDNRNLHKAAQIARAMDTLICWLMFLRRLHPAVDAPASVAVARPLGEPAFGA
eukprot:1446373-Pyramimonas_sp.AAC.1